MVNRAHRRGSRISVRDPTARRIGPLAASINKADGDVFDVQNDRRQLAPAAVRGGWPAAKS
jgi:hypothetical protein